MPTTRALRTETNCPTWSTTFFGARSARTPPKTPRKSIGRAEASAIPPSHANEPVISNTTYPRITSWMFIAAICPSMAR